MNVPTVPYKLQFMKLRHRHKLRIADFRSLLRTKISDSWPLQSRLSEFDFLPSDTKKKDKAILLYAVRCWSDLQRAAIFENRTAPYVSFLIFEEGITRSDGMLWPYLFLANSKLNLLRQCEWRIARGKFVDYLRSLLKDFGLMSEAKIVKYQWKGGESSMRGVVAIEFDDPVCPARKPIHTFFRKAKRVSSRD